MESTFFNRQYINCVSLGWYCGTASSLSKIGLRSRSGPFDWYFSHYWAVLKQIETNFQDFMNWNNLELYKEDTSGRTFIDKKYGFQCNHDIDKDFYSEWESIHQKYLRRAEVFSEMITRPTVFFRCIRDQEEIIYINDNWEYAQDLLKTYNQNNQLVYIYRDGLIGLTNKVQSFSLGFDQYIGKTYEMRHMFDKSSDLLDFCSSLLSTDTIKRNIQFDRTLNLQKDNIASINKCIELKLNGIDCILLESLGASYNSGIYIWGSGTYGIPLALYLKERNVKITGIIDNNLTEKTIAGLNICSFDSVKDGARIFIAVSNEKSNKEILDQISSSHHSTVAIRYQDLNENDISKILSQHNSK